MERLDTPLPRPAAVPREPDALAVTPAIDLARVVADAAPTPPSDTTTDAVVTVAVKTTGRAVARITATRDTSVGEILGRACEELHVEDPDRWVLIAAGEVIGDLDRTIGDLAGLALGTTFTTRLVKRPEAGALAA